MSTLIDTNVLLDVLEERPIGFDWAMRQLEVRASGGDLFINQIVYGEASVPYPSVGAFDQLLSNPWLNREELPWEAGFHAGKAFAEYRKRGGEKLHMLPDLLIGAHAMVKGYALLTRDPARFRTYFPSVPVIAPDTHP